MKGNTILHSAAVKKQTYKPQDKKVSKAASLTSE